MLKRLNTKIIVALCTSCAIIGFAFYERHAASNPVPAVAFYIAAAVTCLLPVSCALLRCKICRNKTLSAR